MSLSYEEQQEILSEFPTNIKLSYANITHKKVSNSDIIMAIPRGNKCFIWFTEYNDENSCFLMEIGDSNKIKKVQRIHLEYNAELVYNTIFYGTLFYEKKTRLFAIEDIFYYKGQNTTQCNWIDKFSIITKMLQMDLACIVKGAKTPFLHFGFPLFSKNLEDLILLTKEVNYRIDTFQYRLFQKVGYYLYTPFEKIGSFLKCDYNSKNDKGNNDKGNNKLILQDSVLNETKYITSSKIQVQNSSKREIVFKIKPDIQNDIYYLYCLDDLGIEKIYDIALIPNFKTSVMMNKLFRNIKENDNLDKLEESDDEEEFENEDPMRFVYLEKTYNMICRFNHKFKKWFPLKLVEGNKPIVQEKELSL
jgi:hypothetical protein